MRRLGRLIMTLTCTVLFPLAAYAEASIPARFVEVGADVQF